MSKNISLGYTLRLTLLLLFSILQISCDCKNQYVGKGEVTEAMVADVEKAIEGYVKGHPNLDTDSKTEFNLLLDTLKKLQRGEKTDIPMHIVNAAAKLGKPDVVQAFIDIMTREVHDVQLEQKLDTRLSIAKLNAKVEKSMRKLKENSHQAATESAQQQEEDRKKEEREELEKKKQEEERLQTFVERRLAVEKAGGIDFNTQRKFFFSDLRNYKVEQIAKTIRYFKRLLQNEASNFTLSQELQQKARKITAQINDVAREITGSLEGIQYSLDHPGDIRSVSYYRPVHLEIANKLLENLKKSKEELRQLLAARGEDISNYEEEPKVETEEEKVAYRELEEAINDPSDTSELVARSKQAMQVLLDRIKGNDAKHKKLKQEAKQVAINTEVVLELLKAKKRAIEKLYFDSDTKDYAHRPIEEGLQKINTLQEAIDTLNKRLRHFCRQFIIDWPNASSIPLITKETLKIAFNALADQLVPDSKLVKTTLGARPLPQTPEAWAALGLEVGFDFIPHGKELKLLAGPDKPALQQKMKNLIVKLIEK